MADNTEALPPLPERDTSKPAEQQGLFRKFIVTRTDGSSEPGGKHEHCEYFVLDVDHDPHAAAALAAYADAVERTHPELAADMRQRYALAQRQQVPPLSEDEVRRLWDKACRTVTVQGGGNDVLVFADYLQREIAQRQRVPTTAWLVEWRFNGVQWLYLWSSAPGGFSFTSDASKALRFARREDAEAALQWARDTDAARRPIGSLTRQGLALGEMLVTEHAWPTFTAAPSAQAERRVECDACPTALGCLGKCMKATPPVAQAEPQVPLPYGFESGLVQLLNEARCLEGRIVGNRELASRIVDYIRRGIGKQEL